MRGKIYTLDELNRALPLIQVVVADIVRGHRELCDELARLGVEENSGVVEGDLLRELPWATRDLVDELRDFVRELGELGVFLLDPQRGLIEAYGIKDGDIVYYTWMLGESEVGFWHGLFGSHRERKPVCAAV